MGKLSSTPDEALISVRGPQTAYTPIVQQLKDNSSNYAQSGSTFSTTVLLRKEAKLQVRGGADVEGQYVNLVPFPGCRPTLSSWHRGTRD